MKDDKLNVEQLNEQQLKELLYNKINERDDKIDRVLNKNERITGTPAKLGILNEKIYIAEIKPYDEIIISIANKLLKSNKKTIDEVYDDERLIVLYFNAKKHNKQEPLSND